MPLPRPFVQFALNFVKELLRDVCEVGTLGNVLTDESVGVLIGSTLPRMVRPCEEESYICSSGNSLVFGELQAIVSSDGLHVHAPQNCTYLKETYDSA